MAKDPADVAEYLDSLDAEHQPDMRALHAAIKKVLPKEKLDFEMGSSGTGIIGYGPYVEVYASGREANNAIAGLSRRKQYIALYVRGAEDAKARLGKVKVGKVCITFKKLDDLNLDVALELVKESARLRAEEVAKGG